MSSLGRRVNEDRWFLTTKLYRTWPSPFNAGDLRLECQEIFFFYFRSVDRLVTLYSNQGLLELSGFCCGCISLSWNEQTASSKLILAILMEVAANAWLINHTFAGAHVNNYSACGTRGRNYKIHFAKLGRIIYVPGTKVTLKLDVQVP